MYVQNACVRAVCDVHMSVRCMHVFAVLAHAICEAVQTISGRSEIRIQITYVFCTHMLCNTKCEAVQAIQDGEDTKDALSL